MIGNYQLSTICTIILDATIELVANLSYLTYDNGGVDGSQDSQYLSQESSIPLKIMMKATIALLMALMAIYGSRLSHPFV